MKPFQKFSVDQSTAFDAESWNLFCWFLVGKVITFCHLPPGYKNECFRVFFCGRFLCVGFRHQWFLPMFFQTRKFGSSEIPVFFEMVITRMPETSFLYKQLVYTRSWICSDYKIVHVTEIPILTVRKSKQAFSPQSTSTCSHVGQCHGHQRAHSKGNTATLVGYKNLQRATTSRNR